MGLEGQRTGSLFAGIDDYHLIYPKFETHIFNGTDQSVKSLKDALVRTAVFTNRNAQHHCYNFGIQKLQKKTMFFALTRERMTKVTAPRQDDYTAVPPARKGARTCVHAPGLPGRSVLRETAAGQDPVCFSNASANATMRLVPSRSAPSRRYFSASSIEEMPPAAFTATAASTFPRSSSTSAKVAP